MIKRWIVSSLLLSLTVPAWAIQLVPIHNNGQAKVNIAAAEFTRIFVNGDRINDVKGVSGQYRLQANKISGQIFIAPSEQHKQSPMTIFITTEHGRTYQLRLLPKPIPADSIELDPPMIKSPQAKSWEEGSAYLHALTTLLVDMYRDHAPEGYSVKSIRQSSHQWLGNVANVTLLKMYVGDHLRGNVYVVKNVMTTPLTLTEQQVYRAGARLVALQQHVIPALGSTKLFMVMSND